MCASQGCFTVWTGGASDGGVVRQGVSSRQGLGMVRRRRQAHLVNFAKWKNAAYDKIVDEVFVTDMKDTTRLMAMFRQAMEIWIPELPDIPLTYNYHRIPMNTTYWKNWSTAENPYVNGAFWHLTYTMVLWNLQPTQ
jgi:peptide/nickel transport system substrate-binding protein